MGDFTKSLQEISVKEIDEVGPKAVSLGELARTGFNIPAGHCLLLNSYTSFKEHNRLQPEIDSILCEMSYEDFESVESKTSDIRKLITSAEFPPGLENEVSDLISALSGREQHSLAVRASRVPGHMGQNCGMAGPFYYLRGTRPVLKHTKICWSSHWSSKAALSRYHRKVDHNVEYVAPIIQAMIHPRVSGILFTAGQGPNAKNEMRIEATWGLGDTVVSGRSMNDLFILRRRGLALREKRIVKKTVMTVFDEKRGSGSKEIAVDSGMMDAEALSERELRKLGEAGLEIERVFGFPQEVEWAFEGKKLFILGSRELQ